MTTAVVFHGQGAQRAGMGEDLFARYPGLTDLAEGVLGYSLRELSSTGAGLDDTVRAQPAIFAVNALAYRRHLDDGGPAPDVLLGHSLGEYNALEAAGVFDFETGLRIVAERARLMSRVRGEMTAVMGLPAAAVTDLLDANPDWRVELATLNAPRQVVVAGPSVADAVRALREAGALGIRPLRVSGPFHTRHMAPVAARFAEYLAAHRGPPAPSRIPVLSNHTARPHEPATVAADLAAQVDHVLRWQSCVEAVLDRDDGATFTEIDGTVLTSFTRQIRRHRARTAVAAGGAR